MNKYLQKYRVTLITLAAVTCLLTAAWFASGAVSTRDEQAEDSQILTQRTELEEKERSAELEQNLEDLDAELREQPSVEQEPKTNLDDLSNQPESENLSVETQKEIFTEEASEDEPLKAEVLTEATPLEETPKLPSISETEASTLQVQTSIPPATPELEQIGEQAEHVPVPSQTNQETIEPIVDESFTVSLTVRCDTVLFHMDRLAPEKHGLIPSDGLIFHTSQAVAYPGENVFNVLQREMKQGRVHLEFAQTPLYNSAYIEGINNLYEFEVGELSGWLYKVNGEFPSYGCSRYQLQAGDWIEWLYTCDLGHDIGGHLAREGQRS